ncbi:MAG: outer membrane protein [Thermoanaerobaculia bacterium]
MKLRALSVAAALLLAASSLSGQVREGTVEIEPFAGYLWGGHFPAGSTAIFPFTVDVEDQLTYGGRIGYNASSVFELEALFQRTETNFVTGSDSGPVFGGGNQQVLGELDIDYWMGYATFNFGHGRAVPYVSFGMGVAVLDPDVPDSPAAPTDTRFTTSIAGGVKIFFTPHFGMRFDGRYFGTLLNDDNGCDGFEDCCCSNGTNWLSNGSATGGLLLAF